ncbi:hypothetical protein ACK8HH_07735 [Gordonia sp. LUNF6]|uniref:hypothetical protein n=1 Tax=unclassified Gordonia (in: high G+C Gram-positive bacteria) TaxID=2657482 RepID=UPI00078200E5|nr:hypothetical protein [Gordonia sp. QH-12]
MTRVPIQDPPAPEPPQAGRPATGVPRRSVLRGGVLAGAAAVAGWSLTACDTGPTQRQLDAETLLPHAQAALRQQRAATALAPRNTAYTEALRTVADQRGAHLKALRDEINRLHSSTADRIDSPPAAPTASVAALGVSIERSATSAADACAGLSGFSAGLLGSISASCQTLAKVQLA